MGAFNYPARLSLLSRYEAGLLNAFNRAMQQLLVCRSADAWTKRWPFPRRQTMMPPSLIDFALQIATCAAAAPGDNRALARRLASAPPPARGFEGVLFLRRTPGPLRSSSEMNSTPASSRVL